MNFVQFINVYVCLVPLQLGSLQRDLTYVVCKLQFKVDSEQLMFENPFMAILFTFRVFAGNLPSGNHHITNIFSFWYLTWGLKPGLTSNKPIHYLLDYDVFKDFGREYSYDLSDLTVSSLISTFFLFSLQEGNVNHIWLVVNCDLRFNKLETTQMKLN